MKLKSPVIRWTIAGLVLLIVSAAMTIPALNVNFSNGPQLLAVAAARFKSPLLTQGAIGTFIYSDGSQGPALEWRGDAAPYSDDILLLVSNVVSCSAVTGTSVAPLTFAPADVKPAFAIAGEAPFAEPQQILIPHASGIRDVTCKLHFSPLHATYSQRRLQIASDVTLGPGDAQWSPLTTTMYTLQPQDADDLHVAHAQAYSGSTYIDNTWIRVQSADYHPVAVQWEDEEASRLHEFVYFIAAAIIGLAISCLLEAVRPWLAGVSET